MSCSFASVKTCAPSGTRRVKSSFSLGRLQPVAEAGASSCDSAQARWSYNERWVSGSLEGIGKMVVAVLQTEKSRDVGTNCSRPEANGSEASLVASRCRRETRVALGCSSKEVRARHRAGLCCLNDLLQSLDSGEPLHLKTRRRPTGRERGASSLRCQIRGRRGRDTPRDCFVQSVQDCGRCTLHFAFPGERSGRVLSGHRAEVGARIAPMKVFAVAAPYGTRGCNQTLCCVHRLCIGFAVWCGWCCSQFQPPSAVGAL